jgi:protein SCO1/2
MKWWASVAVLLLSASSWATQQYAASGMVLKIDRSRKALLVSCDDIPGFMNAMTMSFEVHDAKELDGLAAGAVVSFTLVVDKDSSYAQHIEVHPYETVEQDPLTARRLKLLSRLNSPDASAPQQLAIGATVPDFTLTDQVRRRVSLSQYAGKVVALNFIYTSCALPKFCYRISNNFGVLQRRFKDKMGRDLILLTVTFDPQRDSPERLAHYAENWKANPETWHFLTGDVADVQKVTGMFGMDYFPEEGLMDHSLHTAVIDRQGKLVSNIEGNRFTADQLGDLVNTVLSQPDKKRGAPSHLAHNLPQSKREP